MGNSFGSERPSKAKNPLGHFGWGVEQLHADVSRLFTRDTDTLATINSLLRAKPDAVSAPIDLAVTVYLTELGIAQSLANDAKEYLKSAARCVGRINKERAKCTLSQDGQPPTAQDVAVRQAEAATINQATMMAVGVAVPLLRSMRTVFRKIRQQRAAFFDTAAVAEACAFACLGESTTADPYDETWNALQVLLYQDASDTLCQEIVDEISAKFAAPPPTDNNDDDNNGGATGAGAAADDGAAAREYLARGW